MGIINTEEKRNYFRKFRCEVLTSNPDNKELIKGFESKKAKNQLESYIRDEDKAWEDYYDAGVSLYSDRVDVLFEIADKRVESKMEAKATGQVENWKVEKCVSAIELRHLCKNEKYQLPDEVGIPLGFGLFWEKIVPILLDITKQIGCKYIYLFAADRTEEFEASDVKKLVRYYKNELKFYECDEDDLIIVKPNYDENCYGLIQEVDKLEKNRDAVWHEFSDV